MVLLLLIQCAVAGPVPLYSAVPPPVVSGPPVNTSPALVGLPGPRRLPLLVVVTPAPVVEESPHAFPPLRTRPVRRTAWQDAKTTIEQPGTFVRVADLPSAFQPIQPAVDRLQRPDLD